MKGGNSIIHTEPFSIINYIKKTNLKGQIEIIDDGKFIWDLGEICLIFLVDDEGTTVSYSHRKSIFCEIGHSHENNDNLLSLIEDINNEKRRVHIATSLVGSRFNVEDKVKKKKKSWLLVKHYYSL